MAWQAPPTFAPGFATSAQMNILSDNFLETAPAKATAASWPAHFATTGANTIAQRHIESHAIATFEDTGDTNWADLATIGPQLTIETGEFALVFINARIHNSLAAVTTYASYAVYGDSSIASEEDRAIQVEADSTDADRQGVSDLIAVTPGDNVFNMEYKVTSGTGGFRDRKLIVMGL